MQSEDAKHYEVHFISFKNLKEPSAWNTLMKDQEPYEGHIIVLERYLKKWKKIQAAQDLL